MALINCPECSKEVSNKALNCPNCGNPINTHVSEGHNIDLDKELIEVIKTKGKTSATVLYNEMTGIDLAQSKQYIDDLVSKNNIEPASESSILNVVILIVAIIAIIYGLITFFSV